MCHTIKLMRNLGRIMTQKRRKGMWMAWQRLEEVHIFLEEDLHNLTLQDKVAKLKMDVHLSEDYIARHAQIDPISSGFKRGMRGPSSILTSSRGSWLWIGCLDYIELMVLLLIIL